MECNFNSRRIDGWKCQDIADFCTLEAIDSLIVITDDHNIWPLGVHFAACEVMEDAHLRHVRVLEFINHDVLVFFLQVIT
ncbi:hypothetical protein D3C72_915750 [compost metagenome]